MNCGCRSPIIFVQEYEISEGILTTPSDINIEVQMIPQTDINLLKEKIICEYQRILTQLERGNSPDLQFILNEISVVELESDLDKREYIIQYYLNNEEAIS